MPQKSVIITPLKIIELVVASFLLLMLLLFLFEYYQVAIKKDMVTYPFGSELAMESGWPSYESAEAYRRDSAINLLAYGLIFTVLLRGVFSNRKIYTLISLLLFLLHLLLAHIGYKISS
ncbi:hypothetical protein C5O19_24835 [Siphonobacter curvatus]|uniref:Uncharacterized protein n=1 Tax=Siphonobacter curvatus TaxID=2094562 RepID=A0A2S7IF68_9BACT|nr:hypothetical protein C5O19_24835 [Siphonobacter curvatus]